MSDIHPIGSTETPKHAQNVIVRDPVTGAAIAGTGASAQQVQGTAAAGAAPVGNPVYVGFYNNAGTAVTIPVVATPSDGSSNGRNLLYVGSRGEVFNGSTWDRVKKPNATSRITSAAASTNATVAKASAGDLFMVSGYNAAGAMRYLKFYDKATSPTVGTDTPVLTLPLPPGTAFAYDFPSRYFANGISYALTTGVADADTGALTAADVLALNVGYA